MSDLKRTSRGLTIYNESFELSGVLRYLNEINFREDYFSRILVKFAKLNPREKFEEVRFAKISIREKLKTVDSQI